MDRKSASLRIFPLMLGESHPVLLRAPLAQLPHPVRGILFDMCNVLYDDTVWRRWLLRILTQLGLQTNYHSFFHLWERDHLDAVHRGERSFCEALESFLRSVGMSRGQIEEVQAVREMNLQAEDVAFVGHDTAELAGAAAIGMATIAFNFDPDAQADVHLGRLEEVLDVLPSPHVPLAAAG